LRSVDGRPKGSLTKRGEGRLKGGKEDPSAREISTLSRKEKRESNHINERTTSSREVRGGREERKKKSEKRPSTESILQGEGKKGIRNVSLQTSSNSILRGRQGNSRKEKFERPLNKHLFKLKTSKMSRKLEKRVLLECRGRSRRLVKSARKGLKRKRETRGPQERKSCLPLSHRRPTFSREKSP